MKAEVDTMIKNLVFDLGNVLIEWNPDKIFRNFEADEMRRFLIHTYGTKRIGGPCLCRKLAN